MASSSYSFHELLAIPSSKLHCKNLRRSSLKVIRAQNYKDEGRSSNMVDANLRVLKERIEQVRNKERLERCCTSEQGWNYTPVYSSHYKKQDVLSQCYDLIGLVFGTAGLAVLFGTLVLCMFSLLLHLKQ
ncbi:hypothetical protein DCAR_0312184 [Daucus carota subsp. sativus]|uniref:Uncharacterized protein n=1 Tax=Daucus carota subsp. sativus TaxID=79200 RepID=A0A161XYY7_DAUCS|nr:hypothetical protein DCAR_0312184 [Daucus carota subsp. sativus]